MTLLNETFPTEYNMLGFETTNVHPQVQCTKYIHYVVQTSARTN